MQKRLSLFLVCFFGFIPAGMTADRHLPAGLLEIAPRPAPTIHLQDIDGNSYKLTDDKGSLVFVHFWASWCRPCRKEMPAIQEMWNKLQKEGLKIALINTAEDEDTVFSFLASHAPDIRALMDRDGQVTEQWQPRGLPATYLIDQEGNIRYQALGGRPWNTKTYLDFLRTLIRKHN